MVVYILFLVHPLKRLRLIENESYDNPDRSKFYYLSVGLQASLVGFMFSQFLRVGGVSLVRLLPRRLCGLPAPAIHHEVPAAGSFSK